MKTPEPVVRVFFRRGVLQNSLSHKNGSLKIPIKEIGKGYGLLVQERSISRLRLVR